MNKGNIFVNSWIIQLEHVNVTVTLEHTKNWKKHELYHNAKSLMRSMVVSSTNQNNVQISINYHNSNTELMVVSFKNLLFRMNGLIVLKN